MKLTVFSLIATLMFSSFHNQPDKVVPETLSVFKEVIKVYPTPNNKGSITVSCGNKVPLSFYLFDLEGKLLYQIKLKQNDKHTIAGLNKGIYLYTAFKNDVSVKDGEVVLK